MHMIWEESSELHSKAVRYCSSYKRPNENTAYQGHHNDVGYGSINNYVDRKLFSSKIFCQLNFRLALFLHRRRNRSGWRGHGHYTFTARKN